MRGARPARLKRVDQRPSNADQSDGCYRRKKIKTFTLLQCAVGTNEFWRETSSMGNLVSIQCLRALAVLMVVIAHAFSHQIGVTNKFVVLGGQFGVQLFFVISGFIMVYISGNGPFSAASFLLRRAVRIVPLYWIFTSLAAVAALALPGLFKTTVVTLPHYIESMLFLVHEAPGRGGSSPLLSQGWTLNYEAYFYVLFAALASLTAVSRVSTLSCAFVGLWLIGLAFPISDPVAQFYLSISPLGFALGCWLGLKTINGARVDQLNVGVCGAAAIAGAILATTQAQLGVDAPLSIIGQLITAASLLLLGLRLERQVASWAGVQKIGDASYAIYLSHIFTIGAVLVIAKRLLDLGDLPAIVIVALVSSIAAVVIGIGVHELIEKPITRSLKGATRFLDKKPQPKIATAAQE